MTIIFMNSVNIKASHPNRLLLNLTSKINLKRSGKYVLLSNLSIYYTWKISKTQAKIIHLKYHLRHEMESLN